MSKKHLITLFYLSCLLITPAFSAQEFPDMERLISISKELALTFKHSLCAHEINATQINRVEDLVLPKIMDKRFLGVEPPINWKQLSRDLIHECYPGGNLCLTSVQEESGQCVLQKLPMLILVFAPWFYENCQVINKTLINHWETHKSEVVDMITEALK